MYNNDYLIQIPFMVDEVGSDISEMFVYRHRRETGNEIEEL